MGTCSPDMMEASVLSVVRITGVASTRVSEDCATMESTASMLSSAKLKRYVSPLGEEKPRLTESP